MPLKVYGGFRFRNGKQERAIVAADNIKEVARLTGTTQYYIRGWWSITGNKEEIMLALKTPHKVIWTGEK